MAIAFQILCIGLILGHHFFLSYFNQKPVGQSGLSQAWIQRISQVFAYSVKITLTLIASLSLQQGIWFSIRRKAGLRISTIDALLSVEHRLLSFLNLELWTSAILVVFMAIAIYISPLIVVFVPSALSVGTASSDSNSICNASSLDFANELFQGGSSGVPLLRFVDIGGDINEATYSDQLDITPSPAVVGVTGVTLYSGHYPNLPSPCGTNCSYQQSFSAPSWRCTEPISTDSDNSTSNLYQRVSHNLGVGIENTTYANGKDPIVQVLGRNANYYYYTEEDPVTGRFWFGHAYPVDVEATTFEKALTTEIFYCEFWNTTYTTKNDFSNGVLNISISNLDYLNIVPVIPLDILSGTNLGRVDSNYTFILTPGYPAYYAMHQILNDTFSGKLQWPTEDTVNLDFTQFQSVVNLVEYNNDLRLLIPKQRLRSSIQELSYNMTFALLSNPNFKIHDTASVTCTTTHTMFIWKYNRLTLFIPYLTGLVISFVLLNIGAIMIWFNKGVAPPNEFSTIMLATRNRDLDAIDEANNKAWRKTRLRFYDPRFKDGVEQPLEKSAAATFVVL